jgi:hypothetical protein
MPIVIEKSRYYSLETASLISRVPYKVRRYKLYASERLQTHRIAPIMFRQMRYLPVFSRQVALTLLVLVVIVGVAIAQGDAVPCSIDIPVNVIVPGGRLIRELKSEQFLAKTKHHSLRVLAANDEAGPRRILLVLEAGVPAKIRAVESSVVVDMLFEARSQDSFALLTARGPNKTLPFGSSSDAIISAAKELETRTGGSDPDHRGVLDVLLEGAESFHEARPGDSIVLFTLGLESEHKVKYSRVRKELADRQIRLFGLQFDSVMAGSLQGGMLRFTPRGIDELASQAFFPNYEDLGNLSLDSGGYALDENILGDSQRDYKITADKLEEIKTLASRMHSAIQEYYRLTIEATRDPFSLDLTPNVRKKVASALTIYPRQLPACPASQSR